MKREPIKDCPQPESPLRPVVYGDAWREQNAAKRRALQDEAVRSLCDAAPTLKEMMGDAASPEEHEYDGIGSRFD